MNTHVATFTRPATAPCLDCRWLGGHDATCPVLTGVQAAALDDLAWLHQHNVAGRHRALTWAERQTAQRVLVSLIGHFTFPSEDDDWAPSVLVTWHETTSGSLVVESRLACDGSLVLYESGGRHLDLPHDPALTRALVIPGAATVESGVMA